MVKAEAGVGVGVGVDVGADILRVQKILNDA